MNHTYNQSWFLYVILNAPNSECDRRSPSKFVVKRQKASCLTLPVTYGHLPQSTEGAQGWRPPLGVSYPKGVSDRVSNWKAFGPSAIIFADLIMRCM